MLRTQKRNNVLVCGRRYGKTTIAVNVLAETALSQFPAAYFVPAYKSLLEVWDNFDRILSPVIRRSNANERVIELITGGKIEFWSLEDKDAGRSRKYKTVVVDEAAQLPNLDYSWNQAIRATLIDYSGVAWFMGTPRGKNYFESLWQRGQSDDWQDWASWQIPSSANPYIKPTELADALRDMGPRLFAQEFEAQFLTDMVGALWTSALIEAHRKHVHPELRRIVIAVDPAISTKRTSNLTGIVVAGVDENNHGYVLEDATMKGSPHEWATRVNDLYKHYQADRVIAETNQGGNMVEHTLKTVNPNLPVTSVHVYRGKYLRAEPVASLYESGKVHHVGYHPALEAQMTGWIPGDTSPDRMDALVGAFTHLIIDAPKGAFELSSY